MAKTRTIRLQPPMGGLDESAAFQSQGPFTTPDVSDCWPVDQVAERGRIASRPGFALSHITKLGSGNPVRAIHQVTTVRTSQKRFWADDFPTGSLASVWSAASWVGTAPTIIPESLTVAAYNTDVGAVRTALSDLNASTAYTIRVYIVPYDAGSGTAHHGTHSIYARMDTTTPVGTTAGIIANLTLLGTAGAYYGELIHYTGGVATHYAFTAGTKTYAMPGWFEVKVDGTDITCTWDGTEVLAATTVAAAAGTRFGFGMSCLVNDGVCLDDVFEIEYGSSTTRKDSWPLLIVSSNGVHSYGSTRTTLATSSNTPDLNSATYIDSTELLQKGHYSDHGDYKTQQTDGVLASGGVNLTSSTLGAPNALDPAIDTDNDVVSIDDPVANRGTYAISSVDGTKIALATAGVAGTGLTFRVERGPKTYDPATDALTLWTATSSKGRVPTGCDWICTWRGRIVMGGGLAFPHMWYMSKQDDANNWLYTATDVKRAVAGNLAKYSQIGQQTICGIPFSDDILIVGCVNSLWQFAGDPTFGGSLRNLSREIGIVDTEAWCLSPDGILYFLSNDAIYEMRVGANVYPEPLSRGPLPRRLRNLDREMYETHMAWSQVHGGAFLTVRNKGGGNTQLWFFYPKTRSLWPCVLPSGISVTAVYQWKSRYPGASSVLFATATGYLYRLDPRAHSDMGSEIEAYCDIGPIELWRPPFNGKLASIDGTLGPNSGDVTHGVYVGSSAGALDSASALVTGTWTAGANATTDPQVTGTAAKLRIENGETNKGFQFEGAFATIEQGGRRRE